ncbi:MAG: PilZ domain-containing protein [Gemmataceae bacterium]|nr:PilZ domain-containing protein [Gemmataceae bacterium]
MAEPLTPFEPDLDGNFYGVERRAAVRQPAALWASCRTARDGPGRWRAHVRDISPYGAGLSVAYPFETGALLRLEIESHDLNMVRTLLARVVHAQPEASDTWGIGCAFTTELDEATLKVLQAERARPSAPDSRRWVRFPCDVETACYSRDSSPGERRPARILNVSAGGVGLLLPCEFAEGTLLYIDLPAPRDMAPRKVLMRVVRVSDHGHTGWFLGCEFADRISDSELQALLGPS